MRRFAGMLFVVVVLIVLAQGVTLAASPVKVGAVLKTLSNPFWVAMQQGLIDAATERGVQLDIAAVPTEQDVELQLNTLETMLLRRYDVLLVSPITAANLLPGLVQATRQGIPIVDLDGNLVLDEAAKAGVKVYSQIASNNFEAGRMAARYLISRTGGKGRVIAIEGISGNPTGAARVRGFTETIKAEAPNMQVVATYAGDWDRLKAANIASDALTAYPDLVGVYCANDTMALGVVETVFSLGLQKQVTVIGTDGTSEARDSILQGRLSATVAQLPYLMGRMAIETAVKIKNGERVPLRQDVPLLLMTREVLQTGTHDLLKYIR